MKVFLLVAAAFVVFLFFVGSPGTLDADRRVAEGYAKSAKELAAKQAARQACVEQTVPQATELAKAQQFGDALRLLDACLADFRDPAVVSTRSEVTALQGLDWLKRNPKAPWDERLQALRAVASHSQDMLGPYAVEHKRLEARYDKEQARLEQQAQAAERARRKKEGVKLGMTPDEVLQSSWGRPESVNKSVYSFGTREQWVYGNGHYLYFVNGKLDSIQTSR